MEPDLKTKFLEATFEKDAGGTLTAVASSNTVDRYGEIVDNNGWDLKSFKKNPILLWAHDHSEPAIGVSKKTWVEGTGKHAKLMIQPVLHDLTDKARAIKALVEAGIIKTLSVGFRALESPDGITFTKNELLEVSVVNVPANADAMMMAYKSMKAAGVEEQTMDSLGVPAAVFNRLESLEREVGELSEVVKASPVNPPEIVATRQRLSMLKVIANASDKLLEADKKNVAVDHKQLVKVIKKATEILTVADKGNL